MSDHRPDDPKFIKVLSFDTDDPEFTRGWEAAMLYARVGRGDVIECQLIHSSNATMANRIAELYMCTAEVVPSEEVEGWSFVTIHRNNALREAMGEEC